jgi:hypothetical protein
MQNGPTLVIPAGALSASTRITIQDAGSTSPAGTPLFVLGPAGTTFAKPIALTLPMPSGMTTGSVFWSQPGSTSAFEALDPVITASGAQVTGTHFSNVFVGPACRQSATCTLASDPCHAGSTLCSGGTPVCQPTGTPVPDGYVCGTNLVCIGGSCTLNPGGGNTNCPVVDPANQCCTACTMGLSGPHSAQYTCNCHPNGMGYGDPYTVGLAGVRIYYGNAGEDPSLVLLIGWGGTLVPGTYTDTDANARGSLSATVGGKTYGALVESGLVNYHIGSYTLALASVSHPVQTSTGFIYQVHGTLDATLPASSGQGSSLLVHVSF